MENKILDEPIYKDSNAPIYKYQFTLFNIISSVLFLIGCFHLLFQHGTSEYFPKPFVFVIYFFMWLIPMCVDLFIQHIFVNKQMHKNVTELVIILGFVLVGLFTWF